jgi:hypothetical protein
MNQGERSEQIHCLLRERFAGDTRARDTAISLYDKTGTVAGVVRAHTMDGGWRGMIDLVPEPPTGVFRRHLGWIDNANDDFGRFFDDLAQRGNAQPRYRWKPVELKFFRSVGRTTPSAYASGWSIAYNVRGSLHKSAESVRETMFHETFHLNDHDHGMWSRDKLEPIYQAVLSGCTNKRRRLSTPCLRPFAPNDTMVRGGTFYAFQPGNGVWEYAAELAIRYYREHRAVLAGKSLTKPAFKCGPEENGRSWKLLVDEFFAGIDLVPLCK